MKTENEEALPSDMIFKILTRSSMETVAICKAVSKNWKELIYERLRMFGYFLQIVSHNRFLSVLITENGVVDGDWSADYMGISILASSDEGILLCERYMLYFVCKPTTKQWQILPDPRQWQSKPKPRYRTVVAAIVVCKSRPLHYKIVRILRHDSKSMPTYICEVFDSQSWIWEKIDGDILPSNDFMHDNETSITNDQTIYWLTFEKNVLSFDINKHCFQYFHSPQLDRSLEKRLLQYEDGLAIICTDVVRNEIELWVARDESWTRKMVANMNVAQQALCDYHIIDFYNNDVVFMITDDGGVFYNLKDCSLG